MYKITCKFFIVITLLTGCFYPWLITEIATTTMPSKAYGSLIYQNGQLRGSILIGQSFTKNEYFWSRPSVTNYNTVPAIASNLGPTSKILKNMVEERAKQWANTSLPKEKIPTDLLYASASNIDPHISPQAAFYQVERIANARSLNAEQIARLNSMIDNQTEGKMEVLGSPHVNVLFLNQLLDKEFPKSGL